MYLPATWQVWLFQRSWASISLGLMNWAPVEEGGVAQEGMKPRDEGLKSVKALWFCYQKWQVPALNQGNISRNCCGKFGRLAPKISTSCNLQKTKNILPYSLYCPNFAVLSEILPIAQSKNLKHDFCWL